MHPGEVLREEYLKPLSLSANALSMALRVPASRINDIVLERRGVTVDTAMRLTRYFGGDVQSWINLQSAYDIKIAARAGAPGRARSTAYARSGVTLSCARGAFQPETIIAARCRRGPH